MGKILHIKDAYFEVPEKCKDDIGCMVTLLGMHLQQDKQRLSKVTDEEKCTIQYELITK
jgi:hypothetical protein